MTSLFILSSFSFENYYGIPGLARSLISDAYYDVARKAYLREPYNAADVPTDLRKLIRADYFDPQFFAASAYGRLAARRDGLSLDHQEPGAQLLRRERRGHQRRPRPARDDLSARDRQRQSGGRSRLDRQHNSSWHFASATPKWKSWFDGL